jgi:anti-sigma factor RsiW
MTLGVKELTCRELTEFLADYFAGELGPDGRSLFEGHLADCPDCVAYLRSYAETMRLAKDAYGDEPVPAGVPEQLIRAILAARERVPSSTPSAPREPRRPR